MAVVVTTAVIWAKIAAGLLAMVKPVIAFFIYMSGKRAGRKQRDAEQDAVNIKIKDEYMKIEMEDSDEWF